MIYLQHKYEQCVLIILETSQNNRVSISGCYWIVTDWTFRASYVGRLSVTLQISNSIGAKRVHHFDNGRK